MSSPNDNNHLFADFLDDYFAECEEHLTIIRRNLLALEPLVQQPQIEPILLEELFRSFHSIKGLSGMVGVKQAEQVAHEMESYLRVLREKQVLLSSEGLNALINGTKTLELVIATHRQQSPLPDVTSVLAQLAAVLPHDSSPVSEANARKEPAAPQDEVTAVPSQAEELPVPTPSVALEAAQAPESEGSTLAPSSPSQAPQLTLKPEEQAHLAAAIQRGTPTWCFTFIPETSLAQRGVNVNHIRQRLQSIGDIIHASPQVTANGSIAFNFVVASQAGAEIFAPWREDGLSVTPYLDPGVSHQAVDTESQTPEVEPQEPAHPQPIPSPPPLTTPPTSSNFVRVDLARLDELMQMVGELVITRARLGDNLKVLKSSVPEPLLRSLKETNLTLERQLRDLREGVMRVRLVPIGEIFARMQFVIRDLARESHKQIALELSGQSTEIDKFVVERMMDPLLHLVRNAVSHGLESEAERIAQGKSPEGKIALRASTAGEMVVIEIEDDGRGVDIDKVTKRARSQGLIAPDATPDMPTILDILCSSGFSTRDQADLTSGRGVGMAVVKNTILELGGFFSLDTQVGQGTRFTIQLPLTLVIADALIVHIGGQPFAVPLSSVREVLELQPTAITALENNEIFSHRGSVLPLIRIAQLFGIESTAQGTFNHQRLYVVVIGIHSNAIGIVVERILGQREIVVRPLTDPLVQVMGIAGATELGDGRIVLILDTGALLQVGRLASWKVGSLKAVSY
ncbi:MAG TPA: chemotaxis protein CheA [Stenomitos sp.]